MTVFALHRMLHSALHCTLSEHNRAMHLMQYYYYYFCCTINVVFTGGGRWWLLSIYNLLHLWKGASEIDSEY